MHLHPLPNHTRSKTSWARIKVLCEQTRKMAVFRASSVLLLLLLLHDLPFQMQITTADQLVFFVLPWLFVLPWQLWGTVLTGLTPTNNIISNFWFGFWLENKSSFRSFYALMYCSKKRVYIVRKTKVRNHRRVASSQSAKFQFLLKWWVLQTQPLWGRSR